MTFSLIFKILLLYLLRTVPLIYLSAEKLDLQFSKENPNKDCSGFDLRNQKMKASVEECEAKCLKLVACFGFVYNRKEALCLPKYVAVCPAKSFRAYKWSDYYNLNREKLDLWFSKNRHRLCGGFNLPNEMMKASVEKCKAKCLKLVACVGFVYNRNTRMCFPKEVAVCPAKSFRAHRWTDYYKLNREKLDLRFSTNHNKDCFGFDLRNQKMKASVEKCKSKCLKLVACVGFVYNRQTRMCFPKKVCPAKYFRTYKWSDYYKLNREQVTSTDQELSTDQDISGDEDDASDGYDAPDADVTLMDNQPESKDTGFTKHARSACSTFYFGAPLVMVPPLDSVKQCETKCLQLEACVAYEYIKTNVGTWNCFPKKQICQASHLRVHNPTDYYEINRDTGFTKHARSDCKSYSMGMLRGYSVDSVKQCETKCLQLGQCVGYVYHLYSKKCFPKREICPASELLVSYHHVSDYYEINRGIFYCEGSNKEDDTQKEMHIAALRAHNRLRSKHGAPAMCLDSQLNDEAQQWADQIALSESFKHASDKNGAGENLYMKLNCSANREISAADTVTRAVKIWYSEMDDYDFDSCKYANRIRKNLESGKSGPRVIGHTEMAFTGHFTQVVWKDSVKLGCGISAGKYFPYPTARYVVCRYKSQGNIGGQYCEQVGKLI